MIFQATTLDGCYEINLSPIGDERGWFMRSFSADIFEKEIGQQINWVQTNHSYTAKKGSVRGMHFQHEPFAEIKLVRCIAGAVFDVVVDLRKESLTYLKWFGIELTAANKKQLLIPKGCAHGFQTMEENTELIYAHSEYYKPEQESGVLYDDPVIDIKWPLEVCDISERDKNHQLITP